VNAVRFVRHRHIPIYRVIRRGWADPLDASFSQLRTDSRWNTGEFSALYCCCSQRVAVAVANELFRVGSLTVEDLQPAFRPALAELRWTGTLIDVASTEGVIAAGFDPEYPQKTSKVQTQQAATRWQARGAEGVVCRSASLSRLGLRQWQGNHQRWGEVAIFPANARRTPGLLARRDDAEWLRPGAGG